MSCLAAFIRHIGNAKILHVVVEDIKITRATNITEGTRFCKIGEKILK